jgi:hypothetical protein
MSQASLLAFLKQEGFDQDSSLDLLRGGKNNRVYKVESQGRTAVLKEYHQHPDDPRNRCAAEFSFASFAWNQGIRSIAEPLAVDAGSQFGLYEFIDGEPLAVNEVMKGTVQQAIDFFTLLNSCKWNDGAEKLAIASEACFSIEAHIWRANFRVEKLLAAAEESGMEPEAKAFVRDQLVPAWYGIRSNLIERCRVLRLSEADEIPQMRRVLSPSDFGFHNALRLADGSIRFIDFEYAGWDDVAKTVCDFFLHPAVPVPRDYFRLFVDSVLEGFNHKQLEEQRIELLLPVHQVKWCCILLNEFLPVGDSRRRFSLGAEDDACRKSRQIALAENMLYRSHNLEGAMRCT